MELVFLGIGLVLLLVNCVLLLMLVRRHSHRPIAGLLTNLQAGQVKQEQLFRDELGRSRVESAGIAREQRQEIVNSFQALSDTLFGRMAEFGHSEAAKLDAFSGQLRDTAAEIGRKLDSSREAVDEVLRSVAVDTRHLQTEFRTEITNAFEALARTGDLRASEAMSNQNAQFESTSAAITQALAASGKSNSEAIEQLRSAVETKLVAIQSDNSTKLELIRNNVERKLSETTTNLTNAIEGLKSSVEARLTSIQSDNSLKLDEMRRTVDEKLQSTLEQRLGENFRIVSDRLEQVHAGLGEMRTLASGVGDLKKVLMNIRARGNWGEVQVGALLEQILTPDQYAKDVRANPGSNERVEYAIKLPGKDSAGDPIWLPIDSKFPHQDYERLIEAAENGDAAGINLHAAALEENVCAEARKIFKKYVNPPHTTDFAILFLPTEGLFAEILRRPGIVDRTLRERIVLAGPTTLAALLSSLQIGFRTLAIEKRSTEVWELLGSVKTEFGKFGDALTAVEQKLQQASNKLSDVHMSHRTLNKKLRSVQDLPVVDSGGVLQMGLLSIAAAAGDE
jgi:DNA recombination protein RmuC